MSYRPRVRVDGKRVKVTVAFKATASLPAGVRQTLEAHVVKQFEGIEARAKAAEKTAAALRSECASLMRSVDALQTENAELRRLVALQQRQIQREGLSIMHPPRLTGLHATPAQEGQEESCRPPRSHIVHGKTTERLRSSSRQ